MRAGKGGCGDLIQQDCVEPLQVVGASELRWNCFSCDLAAARFEKGVESRLLNTADQEDLRRAGDRDEERKPARDAIHELFRIVFQVEFRHTLHVLEVLSHSHIRQYLALIARVVDQGKRNGNFRPDVDPLFTAKMVFGILDEMATDWVLSKKNTRMAARAEPVSAFVLGALRES